MKRTLVLAISVLAACAQLSAYDFMVDKLCYNINVDGTSVTVTYQNNSSPRYTDLSGELIILESVNYEGVDYPVTGINYWAFEGCTALTSVTIPKSVTEIGYWAFQYCSGLKTVNWNAKNCAGYSDVTMAPFYQLSGITSFNFGNEVQTIPACLCYGLCRPEKSLQVNTLKSTDDGRC